MPSTNLSAGTAPNRVWPLTESSFYATDSFLEQRGLVPSINVRLAAVRPMKSPTLDPAFEPEYWLVRPRSGDNPNMTPYPPDACAGKMDHMILCIESSNAVEDHNIAHSWLPRDRNVAEIFVTWDRLNQRNADLRQPPRNLAPRQRSNSICLRRGVDCGAVIGIGATMSRRLPSNAVRCEQHKKCSARGRAGLSWQRTMPLIDRNSWLEAWGLWASISSIAIEQITNDDNLS